MNAPSSDLPNLNGEEEAFVRKLADSYVAPELSPAERMTFHARLERRLSRRRTVERWRPVFAGAAVAAALAVLVFARAGVVTPPAGEDSSVVASSASTTPENAILALVTESANGGKVELPDDYLAIEDVFLTD
jgi:anti-sigma-K factor RskA